MRYIGAVPRLLQVAILSAAFVLPGWQAEAGTKQGFTAIGAGTSSCGKWTEDKASDRAIYVEDGTWVLGFVSAFNSLGWKGMNVASETDEDGIIAWIDNYCAANPTKGVVYATTALINFLSAGPHPNDK